MFIQIVQGKVKDAELLRRELRRWRNELKGQAIGYLGTTAGTTADGSGIALFRFESAKDAVKNSMRPDQMKWWGAASKAFEGRTTTTNCKEVDLALGGGSNWAGFVQVIQGKAKNQNNMRKRMREMEAELRMVRPELLGAVCAWHGTGGEFTEAVYFTSAQAAREREAATATSELARQFEALMVGPPKFFDLLTPDFD